MSENIEKLMRELLNSRDNREKVKILEALADIKELGESCASLSEVFRLLVEFIESDDVGLFCWACILVDKLKDIIPENYLTIVAYSIIKKILVSEGEFYTKISSLWLLGEIFSKIKFYIALSSLGSIISLLRDRNEVVRCFAMDTFLMIYELLPEETQYEVFHAVLRNLDERSELIKIHSLYILSKIISYRREFGMLALSRLAQNLVESSEEVRYLTSIVLLEIFRKL